MFFLKQLREGGVYPALINNEEYYRISCLPDDALAKIVSSPLQLIQDPGTPFWFPKWKFKTREEKLIAENLLTTLLDQSVSLGLVVQSENWTRFSRIFIEYVF